MKSVRGGILVLAGFSAIVVMMFFLRGDEPRESSREPSLPSQVVANSTSAPDKTTARTNTPAPAMNFETRAGEMTDEQSAKLAKDFNDKFKPAAEKWFAAYESRLPFSPEDFTLDKFHSRVGSHMYTFMIGDITFTIQDSKNGAKVSYLMTRKGAKELIQLPGPGFVPNLDVPVSQQDVIRMVRADSGVEFKPNEILILPTAAACALNGGAFVDILPAGKDPENAFNFQVTMVFGPDGKLVTYTRNPSF